MADRFWVAGTGSYTDNTNHWAASSGGAPNETLPGASDNIFFDANSFSAGGQTVTIDATSSCLAMDWTGATNTPTLAFGTNQLRPYGNVTFIAAMVTSGGTGSGDGILYLATTDVVLTSNTLVLSCRVTPQIGVTSKLTLADDLNIGTSIFVIAQGAEIDTNGQSVTCGTFQKTGTSTTTLTLGASTINCTYWDCAGANLTVVAGTSTIKVSGTGALSSSGQTFNNVELNGTAHTISGSNTFHKPSFKPAGAQTITFTDTTTQTVSLIERTGTGVITFQGSGVGGWAITKKDSTKVELNNMSISRSTALPVDTWFAPPPSTDGSNNVNWTFKSYPRGAGWWLMSRR